MKKNKVICLMLSFSLLIAACGTSSNVQDQQTTNKEENSEVDASEIDASDETEKASDEEIEDIAKAAYSSLDSASEVANLIASSVIGAWHFSIYSGDNIEYYRSDHLAFSNMADETGLDQTELKSAFSEVLRGTDKEKKLDSFDYYNGFQQPIVCVTAVIKTFENKGLIASNDALLSETKDAIKQISDYDVTKGYIDDLKKYYSETQAFYEYVKNPTGSYNDFEEEMDRFSNSIKTIKSNLAFDLE